MMGYDPTAKFVGHDMGGLRNCKSCNSTQLPSYAAQMQLLLPLVAHLMVIGNIRLSDLT